MDTTLTDLTADGLTIVGFTPLTEDYVLVLEDGRGATPRDVSINLPSSGVYQLVTVDQRVVVRDGGGHVHGVVGCFSRR